MGNGRDAHKPVLSTGKVFLDDVVDTADPACVLAEVRAVADLCWPLMDMGPVERVHADVVALFKGGYPGYRACTTEYHDLRHTMDVFMAMARIMHGATVQGHAIRPAAALAGLLSALLHDTGYIQTGDDLEGTGGKYTLTHVGRSVEFMRAHFARSDMGPAETQLAAELIESTSLTVNFAEYPYSSAEAALLGRMLFASDLIGQMADRAYLEKLHLLYYEFVEGRITMFASEADLLQQTVGFVDAMRARIRDELGDLKAYLEHHFKCRCNIGRDLYTESMDANIAFLGKILAEHGEGYRVMLNRMGILKGMKP